MPSHIVRLTDQDLDDLIQAMEDAQNELCCGEGFPEANALWERWEALIQRFKFGATADDAEDN